MIVAHIVTEHFPPSRGGLEEWTARLAVALRARGVQPIVYINDTFAQYDESSQIDGVELRFLARGRNVIEAPLALNGLSDAERDRLSFLALRNAILREKRKHAKDRHVMVSTFAVSCGFLASTVAENLAISHVA